MLMDKKTSRQISQQLCHILADTYILYVKTQNFHWNLIDPRFYSLHLFFEKQYEELAEAVDDFAERIRTMGSLAPGSMQEFLKLGALEESPAHLSGDEMIQVLLRDHTIVAKHLREHIKPIQDLGDEGTADLLIEKLRFHEKTAWMLQSHLEGGRV